MSVLLDSMSKRKGNVAVGLVNGVKTEILIDSGAELGSVPREFVPEGAKLCNEVRVVGYGGVERTQKSFMCEFIVGGYRKVVKTLIQEDGAPGVMCILPEEDLEDISGLTQEFDKGELCCCAALQSFYFVAVLMQERYPREQWPWIPLRATSTCLQTMTQQRRRRRNA